jgi:hypothetical protein
VHPWPYADNLVPQKPGHCRSSEIERYLYQNLIYWRKTMKVMAVGTLKPLSQEQRQQYLPKEVPATLQLYLDGKMEQFWLRDKEAGVIFLMSVESVDEADRLLKALPLGQATLLTFDLMQIGPLLPLGMLMTAK